MARTTRLIGATIGLVLASGIAGGSWAQAIDPLLEPIKGHVSMSAPECRFFIVKTTHGSSLAHMHNYYGVTVGDEVRGLLYYYGSAGIDIFGKTTLRATVEDGGLDDSDASHTFLRLCDLSSKLPSRPPPAAACTAWRDHISELIDQHRIAKDIDDEALTAIVMQFISARDACTPGRYEIGLQMYEAISIGRVRGFLK